MKLIESIKIKGFRSIQNAPLEGLADLTVLAGLNNSGKSNLLRALNAFFNGYTDVGSPISIDVDYFRPDLKQKKKKRISIALTFSLPSQFTFRTGLEAVKDLLTGQTFEIKKEWTLGDFEPAYFLNDKPLDLENRRKVDQFLQLINFRYIPNRVLPTDLIRNEHQALRDVLVRRLGKKAAGHAKTFQAIHDTSEKMIGALAERLQQASPDIGDVRLATPLSWQDMVFAFGYRLKQGEIELEDTAQGSGIQSFLMFETLALIDRDYFQQFGWRQAAIWAVEEPESSLHSSLEARIASYLLSLSADPKSRLQILCTSHSDLMLQYANKCVYVTCQKGRTNFEMISDNGSALDRISRAGVSRWVHPILHFPLDPVILVEGKYDHAFLEEAFRFFRPKRNVPVTYLERLDTDGRSGGADDTLKYIKAHKAAIKARPQTASTIVILDWDSANKKKEFEKPFTSDDPFKVLVWPDSALNPKLGRSFRGIERSFSDRMIEGAISNGAAIGRTRGGQYMVESDKRDNVKQALLEIVREGLRPEDFVYAKGFIEEILRSAGALP